jgi:hypothetical protein
VRFSVDSVRRLRATALSKLVPRHKWYAAALALSRIEARIEPLVRYRAGARGRAARLHSWIKDLTKIGPFPLPVRGEGVACVAEAAAMGRGIMFCSTHIPLYDMLLQVLLEAGYTPGLTVSDDESLVGGRYQILATAGSVEAVIAGPRAFLRVRAVMRSGGLVMCLLDQNLEGVLYDNALRLAGKISAPVLYWSAQLAADGVIDVKIEKYPALVCDTEEGIRANMAFAEGRRAAWKASLRA